MRQVSVKQFRNRNNNQAKQLTYISQPAKPKLEAFRYQSEGLNFSN